MSIHMSIRIHMLAPVPYPVNNIFLKEFLQQGRGDLIIFISF